MMKKFTREDIQVNQLSNGQALEIKKFDLTGSKPGLHVHIQASVHGAEVQGNPVIWELLRFLGHEEVAIAGSISFIPMVNPLGSNTKSGTYTQGRFNPVTGDNWNRNFIDVIHYDKEITKFDIEKFWQENKNHEHATQVKNYKVMMEEAFDNIEAHLLHYGLSDNVEMNLRLQRQAAKADIILDLHTGPAATRYLYSGEYALKKMKDFPFPHNLIIPHEFGGAMDEASFFPWTELTHYVHEQGESFINPIECYTVELGSEEVISFSDARMDAARILMLLSKRSMIDASVVKKEYAQEIKEILEEKRYACLLKDYATYHVPQAGLIEYLKKPGEKVSKDEVLYKVLDFTPLHSLKDISHCVTQVKAQKDALIINHTPSASVTKGTIAYQVMEEYYEL